MVVVGEWPKTPDFLLLMRCSFAMTRACNFFEILTLNDWFWQHDIQWAYVFEEDISDICLFVNNHLTYSYHEVVLLCGRTASFYVKCVHSVSIEPKALVDCTHTACIKTIFLHKEVENLVNFLLLYLSPAAVGFWVLYHTFIKKELSVE